MYPDDTGYSVCLYQYNHSNKHQCIAIHKDWQVEYLQFDPTNRSHVVMYIYSLRHKNRFRWQLTADSQSIPILLLVVYTP